MTDQSNLARMLVDPELPYQPWDRLPREPIRWYSRFEQYFRPLGPNRSLLAAYNSWRTVERGREPTNTVAQAWAKAAREWEWRLRAELWDAQELALLRQEEAEMRQEWRDRRRDVLVVFVDKLVRSMEAYEPTAEDPPSLSQLTGGFRTMMEQIRAEFADTPVEKSLQVQLPVRRHYHTDDEEGEEAPAGMTDEELSHEVENILAVLSGLPATPATMMQALQDDKPDDAEAENGDSDNSAAPSQTD